MIAYEYRTPDVTLAKFKIRQRQTYPNRQMKCSPTLSILQYSEIERTLHNQYSQGAYNEVNNDRSHTIGLQIYMGTPLIGVLSCTISSPVWRIPRILSSQCHSQFINLSICFHFITYPSLVV